MATLNINKAFILSVQSEPIDTFLHVFKVLCRLTLCMLVRGGKENSSETD